LGELCRVRWVCDLVGPGGLGEGDRGAGAGLGLVETLLAQREALGRIGVVGVLTDAQVVVEKDRVAALSWMPWWLARVRQRINDFSSRQSDRDRIQPSLLRLR
jgi:hypothetical protein